VVWNASHSLLRVCSPLSTTSGLSKLVSRLSAASASRAAEILVGGRVKLSDRPRASLANSAGGVSWSVVEVKKTAEQFSGAIGASGCGQGEFNPGTNNFNNGGRILFMYQSRSVLSAVAVGDAELVTPSWERLVRGGVDIFNKLYHFQAEAGEGVIAGWCTQDPHFADAQVAKNLRACANHSVGT
jgi:hypothetical protein